MFYKVTVLRLLLALMQVQRRLLLGSLPARRANHAVAAASEGRIVVSLFLATQQVICGAVEATRHPDASFLRDVVDRLSEATCCHLVVKFLLAHRRKYFGLGVVASQVSLLLGAALAESHFHFLHGAPRPINTSHVLQRVIVVVVQSSRLTSGETVQIVFDDLTRLGTQLFITLLHLGSRLLDLALELHTG